MRNRTRLRRLIRLVPWPTVLLAMACGGGDKAPTGPGGDAMRFELVALGRAGLPADASPEDCGMTRFYGGRLDVTDDGSWEIQLQVRTEPDGDWTYGDYGEVEDEGGALWFVSGYSGSSYQGGADGGEVRIMYDWCYDGVPDVQLVFAR